MPSPDLVVVGKKVVFADGVRPAALVVRGGRFEAVLRPEAAPKDARRLDAGDCVVMPGLVDSHVHVNEPGRAEWEGFETATRAAAAGGVTTIVDMPLNSVPVTTTSAALNVKREAARGKLRVDCGFWGGVVPGNASELAKMAEAGVCGFKAFMIGSGIDDFPMSGEEDLRAAMVELNRLRLPLLAHAERESCPPGNGSAPTRYGRYLASRPDDWEVSAVAMLKWLSEETCCAVHVVHLSSDRSIAYIEKAKRDGTRMTAETCPHYLTFAAEDIPDGRTEFKCAPPIRGRDNRRDLWGSLASGLIDMVVSDHSPCVPSLKLPEEGDFLKAWGGISSLQFGLAAVWTQARERRTPPEVLARWMCEAPAELAGLAGRKGRIKPGLDADLVIWDPDADLVVEPGIVQHRHKLTPYAGLRLKGRVLKTLLRGRTIYEEGAFPGSPRGELLERH